MSERIKKRLCGIYTDPSEKDNFQVAAGDDHGCAIATSLVR